MDKFKQWYWGNYTQITWFLIGFLIASALASFSKGEYSDMAFSLLLAFANYLLYKQ
jgi:hypothetical protein